MNINKTIQLLEELISNPSLGLPEEVFLLVSRLTPLVNVDLLIKDELGRTLLSWRDDQYVGKGWHIPGGIVRFKEKLETRVKKVAENEINTSIEFDPVPILINQVIASSDQYKIRGHLVSFLYKCYLSSNFIPQNIGLTERDRGFLKWHNSCPKNLIQVQEIYKKFI